MSENSCFSGLPFSKQSEYASYLISVSPPSEIPGGSFTMLDLLKKFEKWIMKVLMVAMTCVLVMATLDLLFLLVVDVMKGEYFLVSVDDLLEIFGLFMLVLIGIELLQTIMKTYLVPGQAHYEVVLSVALIAIARKVIILDLKKVDSMSLFGIAAIILSLSAGYFLMRKCHDKEKE
jgi:uncharacterized membrane protein (DUF373 family)